MKALLKCIDAGKKSRITMPAKEKRIGTNIIR